MRKSLVVGVVLLTAYGGLALRLLQLQVFRHTYYERICRSQRCGYEVLPARRGDIVTSDGIVLARSIPSYGLFIDSRFVDDAYVLLSVLRRILNLTPREVARIMGGIKKGRRFIWVRRTITGRQRRVIKALKLRGVFFTDVWRRVYPLGSFAASVVGFCGVDGQGLGGVEFWADRWLRGLDGRREYERDGCGKRLFVENRFTPPRDGDEVELTIDGVVQEISEKTADEIVKRWSPRWTAVVVADPKTGYILALATRPTFNPADWLSVPASIRRNPVTDYLYEPGSTFKVVTFAALLQEGLVRLDEEVDCEDGVWRIGRRTLHDYHGYEVLSAADVLVKSSNIGTAKLALRMSPSLHHSWLVRFGFGSRTGVEVPYEENGVLRPPAKWSRYSQVSLAMGQEVGVTVLQMVRAFCAVANGGFLPRLHLVSRVVGTDGTTHYRAAVRGRRILDGDVAAMLRRILMCVVEEGTGRRAKSTLYTIAGKTGTAQKLDKRTGRYSTTDYVASFICMAPADLPKIVVAVVVDTPRGETHFGGTVAAPFAKTIVEQVLPYLGVTPDKEQRSEAGGDALRH